MDLIQASQIEEISFRCRFKGCVKIFTNSKNLNLHVLNLHNRPDRPSQRHQVSINNCSKKIDFLIEDMNGFDKNHTEKMVKLEFEEFEK